ncbi:serine carboxypeptidase-like 18 isoform X2 [Ipomoea triloba]|uniref:serine carboxypeptidase-like 18 isoform X2 n=1 Tax=Ipomoea triloba TaxID=35885 RepID=UPI00125CF4CC|nr:serine carboxypeptidase-like 18 isoform X2 [Ipomoea triloba]
MHFQRDAVVFLVVVVLLSSHNHAVEAARGLPVEFLPGFDGPLPFQLQTGYIGVGQNEEIQLFYYFIKSDSNPQEDPLILWITGGRTCSALRTICQQIGPLLVEPVKYNGSLPRLQPFPYSWTKWLIDYPEFLSNPFYVGGHSYAGTTVPIITEMISNGIESGVKPLIQLQGYILGSPKTFPNQSNYNIPFAHGMGLITDQLYESIKENCQGDYTNTNSTSLHCQRDLQTYQQLIESINNKHILEPICLSGSDSTMASLIMLPGQKSLYHDLYTKLKTDPFLVSGLQCRDEWSKLSEYWANDYHVQMALHVRQGTKEKWQLCDESLPYNSIIYNTIPYHVNLSKKGYRSLIYSGDHEMIYPHLSTEAWIKSLNYSIIDDWRSWMVEGQVAGYTMAFANKMTFVTVKGGGHVAPDYRPFESQVMFERWISYENL